MDQHSTSLDPSLGSNEFSLLGLIIGVLLLFVEAMLIPLDLLFGFFNPSIRFFIYIVVPAILIANLLLVPLGMFLESQRRKHAAQPAGGGINEYEDQINRLRTGIFIGITPMFLILTSVGTYQAYWIVQAENPILERPAVSTSPDEDPSQRQAVSGLTCDQCHQDWSLGKF
ncbi:MAG: hypothetical protein ACE15F_08485 [bacterium]